MMMFSAVAAKLAIMMIQVLPMPEKNPDMADEAISGTAPKQSMRK